MIRVSPIAILLALFHIVNCYDGALSHLISVVAVLRITDKNGSVPLLKRVTLGNIHFGRHHSSINPLGVT